MVPKCAGVQNGYFLPYRLKPNSVGCGGTNVFSRRSGRSLKGLAAILERPLITPAGIIRRAHQLSDAIKFSVFDSGPIHEQVANFRSISKIDVKDMRVIEILEAFCSIRTCRQQSRFTDRIFRPSTVSELHDDPTLIE